MTQTYTLAAVPVNKAAYDEVARSLKKSGAEYPFNYPDRIDMNGLCLTVDEEAPKPRTQWHNTDPRNDVGHAILVCIAPGAGPDGRMVTLIRVEDKTITVALPTGCGVHMLFKPEESWDGDWQWCFPPEVT